jgi:hypothetical protein
MSPNLEHGPAYDYLPFLAAHPRRLDLTCHPPLHPPGMQPMNSKSSNSLTKSQNSDYFCQYGGPSLRSRPNEDHYVVRVTLFVLFTW